MMLGGEQAWLDHAARVQARWDRQQTHVQPDWLFSLCVECGWSLELDRAQLRDFRYAVATHDCSHPEEVSQVAAVEEPASVLF